MEENWEVLKSFLPERWREMAVNAEATKGLRKDKNVDNLLRVLFMHLGLGLSLRDTVVRAHQAGLGNMSDVALFKRLKKCKVWLRGMCHAMLRQRVSASLAQSSRRSLRVVDATVISEPGKTGSQWRCHYSITLPQLRCTDVHLTPTRGRGTGESLKRFTFAPGEHVLADRGYCRAGDVAHVVNSGADITMRLHPTTMPLLTPDGAPFELIDALAVLKKPGMVGSWEVRLKGADVRGRLCVLRKSDEATRRAQERSRKRARRNKNTLQPETLALTPYVMVFTTTEAEEYSDEHVLECYRLRWQIELVFKRLKTLIKIGHVPKQDADSAKAWFYGKLLLALLTDRIVEHASTISPWGYEVAITSQSQFEKS